MNQQFTSENFEQSKYQMLLDTMATVHVLKDLCVAIFSTVSGKDELEMKAIIEAKIEKYKKEIADTLYAELGAVPPLHEPTQGNRAS